ncbi:VOC family protein [Pontibacillus litoralis]|uniref:Glyoxalase n=1 Tax=Pontibacillus litoralis JSM 072002 TaxID=1385512 RepID=A0A0A5G3R3_9BACI|nr:VOC family protein [Pontibacillus litoralis]KGX85778.1 glyoxalase [Pontibacillus litoralis JSM 072002]
MKFFREPNTYVGSVNLKVENLQKSIPFYRDVIGLQIIEQTEKKVKLTADGKTTLLTLEQPDFVVGKQDNTTGLYHFALLLPNRLELAKVLKHFIDHNVPIGASDHLVSEALYLNDPDGNGIEIYHDRPEENWDWQASEVKMAVDPLDAPSILNELNGERWEGLPSNTIMGHIHLHVSDLNKALQFYKDGLGFHVVNQFGNQALFMSTGQYHHHIGLNTWQGAGAPPASKESVGLKSFELVFPSEAHREKVIRQVTELGFQVKQEMNIFVTEDPSGNLIKLCI